MTLEDEAEEPAWTEGRAPAADPHEVVEPDDPSPDEIEVITVDDEPPGAPGDTATERPGGARIDEDPSTGPDADEGAPEGPSGDTMRMSLAEATQVWLEDTPSSAARPARAPPARKSGATRLVVVLVLLAAAVAAGLLLFGG